MSLSVALKSFNVLCSGMSTLPAICAYDCVSATVITSAGNASLKVLQDRTAIQIRWASSDLSVLETHPLTPGLRLSRHTITGNTTITVNTITVTAIPAPSNFYNAGMALASLPLLFALLAASSGGLVLYLKHRSRRRNGERSKSRTPRNFKPRILSCGVIVILIGFMVSAIIWIELSCRFIPQADDASKIINSTLSKISPSKLAARSIEPLVNKRQSPMGITTYAELNMTCTFARQSTESLSATRSR
jgi:hypothetical protein